VPNSEAAPAVLPRRHPNTRHLSLLYLSLRRSPLRSRMSRLTVRNRSNPSLPWHRHPQRQYRSRLLHLNLLRQHQPSL
jgi:hypothetical protein